VTVSVDGAVNVLGSASRHLVPGVAERHRVIGTGGFEVSGEGARVRLSNGRTVLDFGSYAVTLFGHRPAPVVDAVHAALDELPTSTRLLANPYAARLAQRLAGTVDPGRLTRISLGLNGSDAVEAALKLALARTGRPAVLAVQNGFHGKSMGALAATADEARRGPVAGFLGPVRHLALEPDAVARALAEQPCAALIVEPVQGEGGGRILPPDLLRRWAGDAHAAGTFVIADEIQCGLRRCGPVSLAVAYGLAPDAVLLGKALGGGVMPLSAAVCTEELFRPLLDDPFFHTATFGGHPASCAAGLAALDLLDAMADRFAAPGVQLADGVTALRGRYPALLADVRVTGLFAALEFGSAEQAGLAVLEAGRRGLLLAQCLTAPTALRMLPPVVVTPAELASALSILDAACAAVARRTARQS
jgi:putrescine aminotransferase